MSTDTLKEYRCYISNRLLCKASWEWQLEIMNADNRILNYVWPNRKHQDIWLKGQNFHSISIDLNCTKCWRLLGRASGLWMVAEIKCNHCHEICLFDTDDIESVRLRTLSSLQLKNFQENRRKERL